MVCSQRLVRGLCSFGMVLVAAGASGCCGMMADGARPLPPALRPSDLSKVTAWISTDVANYRKPFCWRHIELIEVGSCDRGFHRFGLSCHQDCPSGKVDCGLACASSKGECASKTTELVTAPLVLAVNAATLGAGMGATTAARTGLKAATKYDKIKTLAVKVIDKAQDASDAVTVATELKETTEMWIREFVGSFAERTSPRVVETLSQHFCGDALQWVKEQYGLVQLAAMLKLDGVATAESVLTVAAVVDPTGISALIDAYKNPRCAADAPFPNVKVLSPYVK